MNLKALIVQIGTSEAFRDFWAHSGFAFIVVTFWPHWYVYIGVLLLAAAKEFLFDVVAEKDSVAGSTKDFAGYFFGLCLGALHHFLHLPV